MRRLVLSVGLTAVAFGTGMMVSGRPAVKAQSAEGNSSIQSVALDRNADGSYWAVLVVRGGVLHRCAWRPAPSQSVWERPAESYSCTKLKLVFE